MATSQRLVQLCETGPMLDRVLGEWRMPGAALADSLAHALREAVLDGRVRPGDRLPSERRMARDLRLSRGTIVAALTTLRNDGWVATRHGSASVVCLPPRYGERYAPSSVDRHGAAIDLRHAEPAAPMELFLDATRRALERSRRLLLDTGEPGAGLPELRERIAARFTAQGTATRPDQILVTAGARSALATLLAHLRPTRATVENPAYFGTLGLLRHDTTRLTTIAVTDRGWDHAHLRAALGAAGMTVACLSPDFHNPTGAFMDNATRVLVATEAARHNVTVIVDETMRDLDLREHPPAAPPRIARAVAIGSMSKTVWGGLRVGWIRASAGLIERLLLDPITATHVAALPQQLIACELFDQLDQLIADRRAQLRTQRDHLTGLLVDVDAWSFGVPPGGLALWLRLRHASGDTLAARAAALGLDVLPGSGFSADRTLVSWIRVPFTAPVDTLTRAAAILIEAAGSPRDSRVNR